MTDAPPRRGHLLGLDGLRGVLAICVVIAHVTARLAPDLTGTLHLEVFAQAVVTFFVLSGFLIGMPFVSAIVRDQPIRPWLGSYAIARVLRVYPGWIVALLGASLLLQAAFLANALEVQRATPSGPIADGVGPMTDPLRLLLHASLLANYVPGELQTGISPSWTLTVEIAFYVLLPILMLSVAALARRTRLPRETAAMLPGIVLVVVGLASRLLAWWLQVDAGLGLEESEFGANGVAVLSRSLPVWADAFGLGVLGAVLFQRVRDDAISDAAVRRWRLVAWAALAAALVLSLAAYVIAPRFFTAGMGLASIAVIVLLVLPVGVERRPWKVTLVAENRFLAWLGTTSLGIYLWHYPLMLVWERTGWQGDDSVLGAAWNVLVVGGAALAVGSASFVLVERPVMQLRKRWQRRPARTR